MHDDPSINIVTFEFLVKAHPGKVRKVIGARSVRDEDYVQSIYKDLRPQLDPNSVIKIKSEWEPSQRDKYFIEKTFKKAKLEYYWSRPTSDVEWLILWVATGDALKFCIFEGDPRPLGRP